MWKKAIIVPLLKVGKPRDLGSSYRPISLLSPVAKVLERLVLHRMAPLPLRPFQHGFRSGHSTTTALLPLVHAAANGFNERRPPSRTIAMAVDFSRAFDTVNHRKLLDALNNSNLEHNDIRWLNSYLRGRSSLCRYNGSVSPSYLLKAGVPQGSVISPLLFNFFVSSFPETADAVTSYADDFTSLVSGPSVDQLSERLAAHGLHVSDWAAERGLQISHAKSTVTLFTPDKVRESNYHPPVAINSNPLPLDKHPKILGVVFDPHLTFNSHINYTAERAASRLRILKALTGTTWGQQKETLLLTYGALIRSIILYAAPVWYPNAGSVQKLQIIQNSALRIASGCHGAASAEDLHRECKMLTVSHSLTLACQQFLASARRTSHPSFALVTSDPGPRPMKHTLQSRFLPAISGFLQDNITDNAEYRAVLSEIHTSVVADYFENLSPNRVLQAHPPDINTEEASLPRAQRRALAQLRSGFCRHLNDYKFKIKASTMSACPSCRGAIHSVRHLFTCSEHRTSLNVRCLWTDPVAAAAFITSLPFFDLPPLERPPPEPPPGDVQPGDIG